MYQSYIISIENLNDTLEEINDNKWEIVSVTNISNTEQLLLIVKIGDEKKNILSLFKKTEEIEDED